MGLFPILKNPAQVSARWKWLLLQASGNGKTYYCKPYKQAKCEAHKKELCPECWKHLAANEAVCTALAAEIGLPKLECAWVLYQGSTYFGVEYLGVNAKLRDYLEYPGSPLEFLNGVELAGQSLCFDLFVNNTDRTCGNYVYRECDAGKADLFSIDYDKALMGESASVWKDAIRRLARGQFIEQKCVKLVEMLTGDVAVARQSFDATVKRIRQLSPRTIELAVNEVTEVASDWWPEAACPVEIVEALCARLKTFDPDPRLLDIKSPPCIIANGQFTCSGYTVPAMFEGVQFHPGSQRGR